MSLFRQKIKYYVKLEVRNIKDESLTISFNNPLVVQEPWQFTYALSDLIRAYVKSDYKIESVTVSTVH